MSGNTKAAAEGTPAAGAKVVWSGQSVSIQKNVLRAIRFDATDCPDLFPPLAALCCHCSGTSVIRGAGRLRHKESDRALALAAELGKLGAAIELRGDEMRITGARLHGAAVDSRGDHRIAMACAIAALGAAEEVAISRPECVDKSYPRFFDDLATLGVQVR